MTTYRAVPCPCRQRGCSSWMVDPAAAVQGVRFDEPQARAVAALLNAVEDPTVGSALSFVISRAFDSVYGPNGVEGNPWRHYYECALCLGNDFARPATAHRDRERVVHTETCPVGRLLVHLRAVAKEF